MGCYNTILIRCPCGNKVEHQSKAGDCSLKEQLVDGNDVDPRDLADCVAASPFDCDKCGRMLMVQMKTICVVSAL